jgi:transcriptional regulator with XRE-family HTH domain
MSRTLFTEPYRVMLRALVDARLAAGLRQVDLAERLQKPQSFVSKFENGERRIDVVEFLMVVQALGADPNPILADVGDALASEGTTHGTT